MKTKDEARSYAIDLHESMNKSSVSWSEYHEIQIKILKVARRFGLVREFKENGLL